MSKELTEICDKIDDINSLLEENTDHLRMYLQSVPSQLRGIRDLLEVNNELLRIHNALVRDERKEQEP